MSSNANSYKYGHRQYPYDIQYGNGQNIGGHGGGEPPDPLDTQQYLEKLQSIGNSLIWYVAFLPLFGLGFEMFAASRYLGYFLWGLIIAIRILVCRYDYKKLRDMGLWDISKPSWLVLFPVIYISKRSQSLKRSYMPVGIAAACIFFAVIGNGFTESRTYNENNMYEFVSTYGASYINNLPEDDNYSYNPYLTVDGMLNSYCVQTNGTISGDMFVKYDYKKEGGKHYVTASGTKDGKALTIVFLVKYDGYYYGGMDIEEITLDGTVLSDEQADALMKEIFMLEYEYES